MLQIKVNMSVIQPAIKSTKYLDLAIQPAMNNAWAHPAVQNINCDESHNLTCSHEIFAIAYVGVTCHGYMCILV